MEIHAHNPENPLTEREAREKLSHMSVNFLRQIAEADGLPKHNSKNTQIETILRAWFAPGVIPEGMASVAEMLKIAEQFPKGQAPVRKKQTHGKELGF